RPLHRGWGESDSRITGKYGRKSQKAGGMRMGAGKCVVRLGPAERDAALDTMASRELDVVVVGGGVVGAGIALDAATRGLDVGLVEARDFASGTSSRSSKLIHGGLRYLEQLNFDL